MVDLEKIANIFGADTMKKFYEDGLSEPVQEIGKMVTDLIKTLRLFTAPFQYGAAYQDRLIKYLEKVRNSVPEEDQIEAPASLAGPIMERFKYLEDDNYLTDLYINLLSRAINRERINEAHPAFFHIIDQLSPDEAMLLYIIGNERIYIDYTMDLIVIDNKSQFVNRIVKKDTTPTHKITFIENFEMYIRHMESLNLVFWRKSDEHTIQNEQKNKQEHIYILL